MNHDASRAIRRAGRSGALAVALTLLALGVLSTPAGSASPDALDPLLRNLGVRPLWGDPPPFTLRGLDGTPHSLASLKGQAILLYFWAIW